MRGTGDARAAAVPEGETFAKWKAQLVKSSAHPKAAYPIAAAFVRGLPAFAALAGTDDVKSAIATPLISSAVKTALGEFDRVREIFGQSYSDGAVWFYVVPEKQVKKTRAAGSMPLFWKMSIGGVRQREPDRAGLSNAGTQVAGMTKLFNGLENKSSTGFRLFLKNYADRSLNY